MQGQISKKFFNEGFGWICKSCAPKIDKAQNESIPAESRLFTEGEAEHREPNLSTAAFSSWLDTKRRVLQCPHCGVQESLS